MGESQRYLWRAWLTLAVSLGITGLAVWQQDRIPAWARPWTVWNAAPAANQLDSLVSVTLDLPVQDTVMPVIPDVAASLPRFCAALQRLRSGTGKVRIAYFGDSMIEGDLITLTIRRLLQAEFGGAGVGFVGMAPREPGFRQSVRQEVTGLWQPYSILTGRTALPTAISGEGWKLGAQGSGFRFTGTRSYPGSNAFRKVRLLYGPSQTPDSLEYLVVARNDTTDTLSITGERILNEISLIPEPVGKFGLKIFSEARRPWYGVSLEDWTGIYLDNFALRGNTGLQLSILPDSVLRAFQQTLSYDLVVLQFGVNLTQADRTDYRGYEQAMTRVISYLKNNLPGADFLIIGVSDKSTRVDGRMTTDPSIPYILEAQRRAAEANGCAFFNLFEAMGGKNTMVRWVEQKPILANKDYTHPNFRGADTLGQILFNHLMERCATQPAVPDTAAAMP